MPNEPWFTCLPSCETTVPCGPGQHTVGWEAGSLRLASHPDVEGELVLAALGGEKARCVEVAEAWSRHADDLSVLAIGPRGPADEIAVGWDDVAAAAQADQPVRFGGPPGTTLPGTTLPGSTLPGTTLPGSTLPGTIQPGAARAKPLLASRPGPTMARVAAKQRQVQEDMLVAQRRRNDILSLLALGHGFQVRLIGQVAATHAVRLGGRLADPEYAGGERVRPALIAAITGRLALVAETWLGIDPDQVVVSLHHGAGWGSAELTGRGEERRLRVALPAGWLASVWACGLAQVGRYLVVGVERPGWPRARVLGLRSPGAEPEPLDVHASASSPGNVPHWEV